ncbi:MAG TPA: hypothetical protein VF183_13965 [Acidimicrobiales bacterium]
MLSSIHPLGERGRSNRWGLTVTAHVIGAALGGAVTGVALGALGALVALAGVPVEVRAGVLVALAPVAAVIDARGWPRWVPRTRRQVDERWMHAYRGWVYGGGYGFQLGLGFATIVTAATVYLLGATVLVLGSPLAGALVGLAFGLSRGVTILVGRSIRTPARLVDFHRALVARRPLGIAAAVAGDVAVVLGATVVLLDQGAG